MSRPLRVEFLGALYHITVRGNKRDKIFSDYKDRKIFLDTLSETIKTHNWICHAYCLMTNHFHLVIETPEGNLSKGMRDLNGIYTQRYNRRHDSVGHVFQGRFKATLIEKDIYLLEVARYTVLNPIRAKMVKNPSDWKWSSYRATAGIDKAPKWLTTNWILTLFANNLSRARTEYKNFVKGGVGAESPFLKVGKGAILGSLQFMHEVCADDYTREDIKEIPRAERIIGRPSLSDIFDDINTRSKRDVFIEFARDRCGYSSSEIARHLKISPSAVSLITKKCKKQLKSPRKTKNSQLKT